MKSTITIRISYSSLKYLKAVFPANRGETMISYFDRLGVYLKNLDTWIKEANQMKELQR